MDKAQLQLIEMRRNAQRSGQDWHVYPLNEATIHTLKITQATVDSNGACAISGPGAACWCEPDVEDYRPNGGGMLIKHRQVRWQ